jgi:hypothetical protein
MSDQEDDLPIGWAMYSTISKPCNALKSRVPETKVERVLTKSSSTEELAGEPLFDVLADLVEQLSKSLEALVRTLQEKNFLVPGGSEKAIHENYNVLLTLDERVQVCLLTLTALLGDLRHPDSIKQLGNVSVPEAVACHVRQACRTWRNLSDSMATAIVHLTQSLQQLFAERWEDWKVLDRFYQSHRVILEKESRLLDHVRRVHAVVFSDMEQQRVAERRKLSDAASLEERYERLRRAHDILQLRFEWLSADWKQIHDSFQNMHHNAYASCERLELPHRWTAGHATCCWPAGHDGSVRTAPMSWPVLQARLPTESDQMAPRTVERTSGRRWTFSNDNLVRNAERNPTRPHSVVSSLHVLAASLKADAHRLAMTAGYM